MMLMMTSTLFFALIVELQRYSTMVSGKNRNRNIRLEKTNSVHSISISVCQKTFKYKHIKFRHQMQSGFPKNQPDPEMPRQRCGILPFVLSILLQRCILSASF